MPWAGLAGGRGAHEEGPWKDGHFPFLLPYRHPVSHSPTQNPPQLGPPLGWTQAPFSHRPRGEAGGR